MTNITKERRSFRNYFFFDNSFTFLSFTIETFSLIDFKIFLEISCIPRNIFKILYARPTFFYCIRKYFPTTNYYFFTFFLFESVSFSRRIDRDSKRLQECVVELGEVPTDFDRSMLQNDLVNFVDDYGGQSIDEFDLSGSLNGMIEIIRNYMVVGSQKLLTDSKRTQYRN